MEQLIFAIPGYKGAAKKGLVNAMHIVRIGHFHLALFFKT
jgi:hypothetical protein